MKFPIPEAALAQHVAILGKTGSGKTSTGKLIVEHVVERGARVCVLDPIKSDWWGLTSSADGRHAGLPFSILGGPRGHVPLHASAGKAIGELVARGDLRHSIIDMADFEAGGHSRFFIDFADALMKRMRGVLYLVLEEAHEFGPKERTGIGSENMAIYYAKKLATAGRSKGIRLVLLTHRVQSLHNALLGSCDTLIAHRLTAPADQDPVNKWLKANAPAEVRQEVAESLSGLRTGTGWLCSGEARQFERIEFPRIATYDNTATPEDDAHEHEVKTAPVDLEQLRKIIGNVVAEAEANDPAMLKKRIRDLERQVELQQVAAQGIPAQAEVEGAYKNGYDAGLEAGGQAASLRYEALLTALRADIERHQKSIHDLARAALEVGEDLRDLKPVTLPEPELTVTTHPPARALRPATRQALAEVAHAAARQVSTRLKPGLQRRQNGAGDAELGSGGKRRILTALAQYPAGLSTRKLSILIDMSPKGGTWRTYMADLRSRGWIQGGGDHLQITHEGAVALGGDWDPLPTGRELIDYWRRRLGDSGKRAIFDVVVGAHPRAIAQEIVSERTNIAIAGGTWRTYMSELRGLGLIEGRGELRASEDLFG